MSLVLPNPHGGSSPKKFMINTLTHPTGESLYRTTTVNYINTSNKLLVSCIHNSQTYILKGLKLIKYTFRVHFQLTMKTFKTLKIQIFFQQITVRCTNGSLECTKITFFLYHTCIVIYSKE